MAYCGQLQRLSFGFHDRVHTGELITRAMLDLEGSRMLINAGILRLVLFAVLVGAGAFLLLRQEPALGPIALSFVPFGAWRSVVARLRLRARRSAACPRGLLTGPAGRPRPAGQRQPS